MLPDTQCLEVSKVMERGRALGGLRTHRAGPLHTGQPCLPDTQCLEVRKVMERGRAAGPRGLGTHRAGPLHTVQPCCLIHNV